MSVINNPRFVRFWALSWTITHHFGVPKLFPWLSNPRCAYMLVVKTRSFGRFWPVPWTITQFCGPEVISTIDEPRARLRVGHQHSQFWPILVRFMHYYSVFWGPRAISTIDDPRGAFTCPSSTLIVLANSDPFHGPLLIVLGSQSDFHSC